MKLETSWVHVIYLLIATIRECSDVIAVLATTMVYSVYLAILNERKRIFDYSWTTLYSGKYTIITLSYSFYDTNMQK